MVALVVPQQKSAGALPGRAADLLRAALAADPATAAAAWRRWQAATVLDDVPGDEYHLLPKLYTNLTTHGLPEDADPRIAGIYRRTWYLNQRLEARARAICARLAQCGIGHAVVHDLAAVELYGSSGQRPLTQVDLLIAPQAVGEAMDALAGDGWQPERAPALITRTAYQRWMSLVCLRRQGAEPLLLHWRLLPTAPAWHFPAANGDAWFDRCGQPWRPTREVQLVVASHQAMLGGNKSLLYLADAAMIVGATAPLEWTAVTRLAAELQAALPLAHTLRLLEKMGLSPANTATSAVLAELDRQSLNELANEHIPPQVRSTAAGLAGRARFHWQRWRRIVRANGGRASAASFLEYLCANRGVDTVGQLPWQVIHRAVPRRSTT